MLVFTDEFYPAVLVAHFGPTTSRELDEHVDWLRPITARAVREAQPLVVLIDGRSADSLTAAQRKKVSELFETYDRAQVEIIKGNVAIIPSALSRGVLTALKWVSATAPNVHPRRNKTR